MESDPPEFNSAFLTNQLYNFKQMIDTLRLCFPICRMRPLAEPISWGGYEDYIWEYLQSIYFWHARSTRQVVSFIIMATILIFLLALNIS